MSDARLRELERAWRSSGREADEVAWLRERVRVGALASERLELAAFLGHSAAVTACDGRVQPRVRQGHEWAYELAPWGREAIARVGLALAELVAPRFERPHPAELALDRALAVTRAWCACPCDAHRERAKLAGGFAIGAAHEQCARDPVRFGVLEVVGLATITLEAEAPQAILSSALHFLYLAPIASLAQVRSAAGDVVPWALGIRDPLADVLERGADRLELLASRWRSSGAPSDGAAWLTERIRQGDIEDGRVMQAAQLGDPASTLAAVRPIDRIHPASIEWGDAWSGEDGVRLAIAAATHLVSVLGAKAIWRETAARGLDAAAAWLACKIDARRARVRQAWDELRSIDSDEPALRAMREAFRWSAAREPGPPPPVQPETRTEPADEDAAVEAMILRIEQWGAGLDRRARPLARGEEESLDLDQSSSAAAANALRLAVEALAAHGVPDAETHLLAALREALVPWLLRPAPG